MTTAPSFRDSSIMRTIAPDHIADLKTCAVRQHYTAVGSIVFYALFSAAVCTALACTAPIYLPFAGCGVIFLSSKVKRAYENWEELSKRNQTKAERFQNVKFQFEAIQSYSPEEIQRLLAQMGINWQNVTGMSQDPARLNLLKPLLAVYLDLKKQIDERPAPLQERTINILKVRAAFIQAIILRPTYKDGLQKLCTCCKNSENFITFHNRSIAPIAYQDVERLSIQELRSRLLNAMQN